MSNIIKGLSRASSSRSLRSHDSSVSSLDNFAYDLVNSSYESNGHLKKFNNSKLEEEMIQIENQLKNLSNMSSFVSKFLFLNKSPSQLFSLILINLL